MSGEPIRRYEFTTSGALMSTFVATGGLVHSCFVPLDLKADIEGQTADCLRQIDEYLAIAGTDKSRILTATIFIKDMALYAGHARAWNAWVDPANPPARACVTADMYHRRCLIEIKFTAAL